MSELFPIDKIDLCAGEVRVSPEGLRELAKIAAFSCRRECERRLTEIQENGIYSVSNPYAAISAAENLSIAAKHLALSLQFLNAFRSLEKGERKTLTLYPQKK